MVRPAGIEPATCGFEARIRNFSNSLILRLVSHFYLDGQRVENFRSVPVSSMCSSPFGRILAQE